MKQYVLYYKDFPTNGAYDYLLDYSAAEGAKWSYSNRLTKRVKRFKTRAYARKIRNTIGGSNAATFIGIKEVSA